MDIYQWNYSTPSNAEIYNHPVSATFQLLLGLPRWVLVLFLKAKLHGFLAPSMYTHAPLMSASVI